MVRRFLFLTDDVFVFIILFLIKMSAYNDKKLIQN